MEGEALGIDPEGDEDVFTARRGSMRTFMKINESHGQEKVNG